MGFPYWAILWNMAVKHCWDRQPWRKQQSAVPVTLLNVNYKNLEAKQQNGKPGGQNNGRKPEKESRIYVGNEQVKLWNFFLIFRVQVPKAGLKGQEYEIIIGKRGTLSLDRSQWVRLLLHVIFSACTSIYLINISKKVNSAYWAKERLFKIKYKYSFCIQWIT